MLMNAIDLTGIELKQINKFRSIKCFEIKLYRAHHNVSSDEYSVSETVSSKMISLAWFSLVSGQGWRNIKRG